MSGKSGMTYLTANQTNFTAGQTVTTMMQSATGFDKEHLDKDGIVLRNARLVDLAKDDAALGRDQVNEQGKQNEFDM